jgi:large subunit ribosomal protein L9
MSKTEVILTSNIIGLGAESDQVKVAAGYARNFLFPQRLAIPLTSANKRHIEALKQRRAEREAHEFNTMSELAKGVGKLVCVVQVKTGDDGKIFGSVTAGAIADQLKHQFDISLDKRKIHIDHPLRTLGEHDVELRLHQQVTATLKVRVESTTPLAVPAETPAPEARRDDRPDRRSRRPEPRHGDAAEPAPAEKAEPADKKPRAAKGEARSAKAEKPAKAEKAEKPARAEKTGKSTKAEKAE